MIRDIIMFLFTMTLTAGGCNFQIPKLGTVADPDAFNTTPTSIDNDVSNVTDTIAYGTTDVTSLDHTDTTLGTSTDSSITDVVMDMDGTQNPSIRTCTTDAECENSALAGTYGCEDGFCVSPSLRCTVDTDCSDHNECTGTELCYHKRCALAPTVHCDDGDEWTADFCTPASGCETYPLWECTQNSDCVDPDLYCDAEIGGWCMEVTPCYLDADCEDGNACTVDRCLVGRCDNESIACFDFNPNTIDACYPESGCVSTEGCHENRDCSDFDLNTADICTGGQCTHTVVYVFLSVLSIDYDHDPLELHFGPGMVWVGTIPYQMHIPFKEACDNGLEIYILGQNPPNCPPLLEEDIDVWINNQATYSTVLGQGCQQRIFVPPESLGCNTPADVP